MLRSLKEIMAYRIVATDGELGIVTDFYFDDITWCIRYVVVRTGKWLSGRLVLISPLSVGQPDHGNRVLPVTLTVKQVAESPPIETDLPVSKQHEIRLASYYNLPLHWGLAGIAVSELVLGMAPDSAFKRVDHPGDPHLRSADAISAYSIQAVDKAIGHVVDFIAETEGWSIRYMVAATRDFLPGKKVLVAPDWLMKVDWANRLVHVNLTSEQIKGCEEYNPSKPVNREIEMRLYDFYGRPKYWESKNAGPK